MNNQNSIPTPDEGNSQPLWLEVLCDRFKSAWGSSQQISIESILKTVAADKRELVLNSLLRLETDLRTKSGNPPTADELSRRFPDDSGIIATVLQNPPRGDSAADATSRSNDETIPPKSPPHDGNDDDEGDDTGDGVSGFGPMRIPRQLGRYRIIRKLGQGAMGSVFLAHDEQLNRQVALKIPRGNLQRNTELRTRFEREAQAAAALHHPGICPIFDVGQFEGIHYICMGYIEGFSLSRYAVSESGLSELDIAELVYKLARALAVAHEAGFIHRDLKPANVMVNQANDPVILDFGLARRIDRNEDLKVTQTGTAIGSPAYMSPEQVDGDQDKIGIPSDVYSLGVILYELLAGRVPFEGSMGSVLGQIMSKDPAKPSDFRKDLSVRLENICLKMMAKDPAKRHPSMHAVAADLKEYLEKYSALSSASASPPETQTADRADQRKQQIEQLIKSGDYGQAEKLLVVLSRETDALLQDAATWAATEIPKLRKTRDEVRAGRQEMYTTAVRLMKSHDYEQAARLLQEYPYDLRTPKMQQLLERAESLSDEVDQIRKGIQTARTRGNNEQLLILLNALLELKPADRKAKELRELLTKRSVGPISNLLGTQQPSFIKEMGVGLQWLTLIGLVALACGYPAWKWSYDFLTRKSDGSAIADLPYNDRQSLNSEHKSSRGDFDETSGEISSALRNFAFPDSGRFINARPLRALNTRTTSQAPLNAYPLLSPDGLTVWWTREGNDFDQPGIYQATRDSASSEFTNIHCVLADARLASVAPSGLEIVCLFDGGSDGQLRQLGTSIRSSIESNFPHPAAIEAFRSIENPKGTAFSSDGLQLYIRGFRRSNANGSEILVASRTSSTAEWEAPKVATVTSDARFQHVTWPSTAESNLLLFAGNQITVSLDGRQVLNTDLSSISGLQSKTPEAFRPSGAIALQLSDTPIAFRNARIRRLNRQQDAREQAAVADPVSIPQSDWIPLFNGRDLTGWQQLGSSDWSVSNGAIRGVTREGQVRGWLMSENEYSDYELELEYKLSESCNSGVCPRAWRDAEAKGSQIGEIQLLESKAEQTTNYADNGRNGSLFGHVVPLTRLQTTANQWHTLRYVVKGQHLLATINGTRVLDCDVPFLKPGGHIALQPNSNQVEFRSIRIREIGKTAAFQAPKQPIDLTAMLNPQRDFLDKTFKLTNGKLLTPPRVKGDLTNALLMIPFHPVPDSYDVRLVVERHSDMGFGCNFGVVMGGRQVTVDMDGSGSIAEGKPRKWCLGHIDGFSMHDERNPTVVVGNRFQRGRQVTVDIQVRANNIKVIVDDQRIIDWTGRPDQLSVWDSIEPRLTRKDSLYFFSQAAFIIHEMTLTPIP